MVALVLQMVLSNGGGVLVAVVVTVTLLELSRQVPTSILSKVDLKISVVFKRLDPIDGLDGVGDVNKVNEGTILLLQVIDLLNITKLGEIFSQLQWIEVVKINDVSYVDVSRCTV